MYPRRVAALTLAAIVNQILPFSLDTANSAPAHIAAGLIKTIITIAAFLLIPASIKLAGDGLGRVGGLISDFGRRGQKSLRNSDMWSEGARVRRDRQASFMK